jgi:hypothetical protein
MKQISLKKKTTKKSRNSFRCTKKTKTSKPTNNQANKRQHIVEGVKRKVSSQNKTHAKNDTIFLKMMGEDKINYQHNRQI